MSRFVAGAIAFLTSAAVLILEIVAARLLAPYVGVTLETYTAIIGVVLAGISSGAWIGGWLADRFDPARLIPVLIVSGGALAMLSVPVVRWLGPGVRPLRAADTVLVVAAAFALPAIVLSAESPALIKQQLRTFDHSGTVVGQLSALGTAGALVGTFGAGFLLVTALPSTGIILGVGGTLVVLGMAVWFLLRPASGGAALVAVPLVLGLGSGGAALMVSNRCQLETAYVCAAVEVDETRPSGRRLVLDDLWHSYVDLDDPAHLEFAYAKLFAAALDASHPGDDPIATLLLGGGAYTLPRYVGATRPGSTNVVLELDPELVRFVRERIGEDPAARLDIRTGDARITMRSQPNASFDVVFGDAFGRQAAPWHLATKEFIEQVRGKLRPGGVYVLNVIDSAPLAFVKAELVTVGAVFDHVAVMGASGAMAGEYGDNFVILASDEPLPVGSIVRLGAERGLDLDLRAGADARTWAGPRRLLTDDFAPVDQLQSPIR